MEHNNIKNKSMERDLPFGSLTFLYLMFLLVRATFPDSDPILNGRVIHVFPVPSWRSKENTV